MISAFSGLLLVVLAVILFEPIQSEIKVRSEVRKWRDHIRRQQASLPGGGQGVAMDLPSTAGRVPTSISSNLTLSAAQSPWMVTEDVTVHRGATLSLEPGTELRFADQATLFVFGSLRAEGESAHPIRMVSFSPSNYWAGIFLGKGSAPSRLQQVEIANAQYGVRAVLSQVTLEDCVARNLRETCSAMSSKTVFRNCRILFEDFRLTGNINVFKFFKGAVLIENCDIYCPDTDVKIDALDVDQVESAIFRANRIHGAVCQGADGIDVGVRSRNVLIEGNLISDLVDKGISVGEGASVIISNNVILRCGMGVGIKDQARALITHTTFYGNDVGVKCYEKVPGEGGGHAVVRHCVFAANTNAPVAADALSTIVVSDSLCDTHKVPGENNAQGTPHFENPELDLFNLLPDPSGSDTDAASGPRKATFTGSDLGAHIAKPGIKQ